MTKSECLLILAALPQNEKVRLIIDTEAVQVDSMQLPCIHYDWVQNEFSSPWNGVQGEVSCIELVGSDFNTTKMDGFDFACWFNDITNPSIEPAAIEYTKEQQEQMWALHYETTQQNHVGYLSTSKGE